MKHRGKYLISYCKDGIDFTYKIEASSQRSARKEIRRSFPKGRLIITPLYDKAK